MRLFLMGFKIFICVHFSFVCFLIMIYMEVNNFFSGCSICGSIFVDVICQGNHSNTFQI